MISIGFMLSFGNYAANSTIIVNISSALSTCCSREEIGEMQAETFTIANNFQRVRTDSQVVFICLYQMINGLGVISVKIASGILVFFEHCNELVAVLVDSFCRPYPCRKCARDLGSNCQHTQRMQRARHNRRSCPCIFVSLM